MDGARFDRLARALVAARSRRSLGGLLAGALGGLLGRGEAAARCKRDGERCGFNSECCSTTCATWDGISGNRCPRNSTCYCRGNGDWGTECDAAADCEKRFGTDERWRCAQGWCLSPCSPAAECRPDQVCRDRGDGPRCWRRCTDDGEPCWFTEGWKNSYGVCSRGICYPIPYVGTWCHDYGPDCRGGSVCTAQPGGAGTCRCRPGQTVCGTGKAAYCSDLDYDEANCGKCGAKCPNDPTIRCSQGRCLCPAGQTLCGTGETARCRDLQTNPFHCGRCGAQCLTRFQRCQGGRCCNRDGVACPQACGPGGRCGGCCSGVCRLDGTCGTVSGTECLATGESCPGGCPPEKPCPGCCDGTCNASGMCSPHGCAFGTQPCDDNTPCCSTGPSDGDGAFICKDNGGPTRVCWWN